MLFAALLIGFSSSLFAYPLWLAFAQAKSFHEKAG